MANERVNQDKAALQIVGVTNLDNLTRLGAYKYDAGSQNAPNKYGGTVVVIEHNNLYCTQIAFFMRDAGVTAIFIRTMGAGAFGNWVQLIES